MEYVLDYEYISKVLCVNKEKPALKCNGKCHLMKQLANESDTQEENTLSIESIFSVVFFNPVQKEYQPLKQFVQKTVLYTYDTHHYKFLFYQELIKPPQF